MPDPSNSTVETSPRPGRKPKGDQYLARGEPMVWVAGGTLAAILLGAITLLLVLLANGLAYFWPARLEELQLADGRHVLGRRIGSVSDGKNNTDFPFRTANKGFDPKTQAIRRIKESDVAASTYPADAVVVERLENSEFYGVFVAVKAPGLDCRPEMTRSGNCIRPCGKSRPSVRRNSSRCSNKYPPSATSAIAAQNAQLALIYKKEKIESAETPDQEQLAALSVKIARLQAAIAALDAESRDRVAERSSVEAGLRKNEAVFRDSAGKSRSIALIDIIRVYQPNSTGVFRKLGQYFTKVWELLSTGPASRTRRAACCRRSSAR